MVIVVWAGILSGLVERCRRYRGTHYYNLQVEMIILRWIIEMECDGKDWTDLAQGGKQ
jgi:hypothetical protein